MARNRRTKERLKKLIMGAFLLLGAVGLFTRLGTPMRTILTAIKKELGLDEIAVTFPEGFTRFDMAERLEAKGICSAKDFLTATANPALADRRGIAASTLEGYLFPETYNFKRHTPAAEVAERLLDEWEARVAPLLDTDDPSTTRKTMSWSIHQIVTFASLIEKESGYTSELPIIAGVFINRLRDPSFKPKRLQTDPAVVYGCIAVTPRPKGCPARLRPITQSMLDDTSNPYNTNRIEGLPPGPIANPGIRAIRAALSPSKHGYFYFVAKGDGQSFFTSTLEEHNAAVRKYLGR